MVGNRILDVHEVVGVVEIGDRMEVHEPHAFAHPFVLRDRGRVHPARSLSNLLARSGI